MKEPVICPSSDSILAGDRIYDTIFRTWAIMSFFRQGTSLSLLLENCFLWLLSESDCFLTFWFLFSAPFIQQQSINSGLAYSLTWDDVGSHFAFIHKVDSLSQYLTMWAFLNKNIAVTCSDARCGDGWVLELSPVSIQAIRRSFAVRRAFAVRCKSVSARLIRESLW